MAANILKLGCWPCNILVNGCQHPKIRMLAQAAVAWPGPEPHGPDILVFSYMLGFLILRPCRLKNGCVPLSLCLFSFLVVVVLVVEYPFRVMHDLEDISGIS